MLERTSQRGDDTGDPPYASGGFRRINPNRPDNHIPRMAQKSRRPVQTAEATAADSRGRLRQHCPRLRATYKRGGCRIQVAIRDDAQVNRNVMVARRAAAQAARALRGRNLAAVPLLRRGRDELAALSLARFTAEVDVSSNGGLRMDSFSGAGHPQPAANSTA
jgi:hypothetical protein